MSYQQRPGPYPYQSGPPLPELPQPKRHRGRNITIGVVSAFVLLIVIAAAAGGGKKNTPSPGAAAPAATSVSVPSATASTMAPNVVGRSLAQAETAVGSNVTVTPTDLLRGRVVILPSDWKVCAQDPAAGAPLAGHLAAGVVKYGEECPQSAPSAAAAPSASSAASGGTVTFSITGDAPAGVNITYGSDSVSDQGSTLPFTATLPLDNSGSTLYYDINAQLQGGGSISCSLRVNGQVLKSGQASGGYNICMVEIGQNPLTGQWTGE